MNSVETRQYLQKVKVKKMALNAKEKKFAENYALHGNKRKCYLEAFPECVSNEAADASSARLLKKPEVAEYIQTMRKEALERIGEKFDYIATQLVDDIEYRNEKGQKSATWAKSMQMLQNMYGFQSMKLDVAAQNEIIINIRKENEDE